MSRRFRHLLGYLSFLLAAIALVSQLALGAMVLPDDDARGAIAALDATVILCGADHPSGHTGPASHKHQHAAPALCPISIALALPGVITTSAPELTTIYESVLFLRARERPPGRGPPEATARVGAPRAPPLTT
jgi:hypothetical protein